MQAPHAAIKTMSREHSDAVTVLQTGGGYSNVDFAKMDSTVSEQCDYCGTDVGTIYHMVWECPFFQNTRKQTDEEIAAVPCQY